MNGIISKSILIFITGIFILALISYSFFAGEREEIKAPIFNIEELGVTKTGSLIIDKVDFLTTVYSKKKDYTVGKNIIRFGSGTYIIDSRDSFQNYILDLGTNRITLNGGGMVYIDNDNEYKKIVSFNNKIKVDFLIDKIDEKSKRIIKDKTVEFYLYPHMYIGFYPRRFKRVKSADSLRISQLATALKYFNSNFSDIINKEGLPFIGDTSKKEFLKKGLIEIVNKQKKYSIELDKKNNIEVADINGIDFIEKYFVIFYNDRKKSIYYKNKILRDSIELLSSNKKESRAISRILLNISSLKEVNLKEYENMKLLIRKIYFLSLYQLGGNSVQMESNYDNIIIKLFNSRDSRKIKLLKKVDKYNYLGDMVDYLQLLDLSLTNKDLDSLSIEYYILFKKNMLVSNFSNKELPDNLYNLLLKGIISYSQNIENFFKEDESNTSNKTIQNIIYNKFLLDIFNETLSFRYFEKERDKQGLLVLKGIDIDNIEKVRIAVNKILKRYKKGIKYLEANKEKYGDLIKKYTELDKIIKEYLSALINYSLYEENNSKVNRAFIDVEVYTDDEENLSFETFKNYIKIFIGVDNSSIDLEIIDNTYYKINSIYINNYNFSFDLYPFSGYLLKNIKLKDKDIKEGTRKFGFYNILESTSFSLEKEKEKYKEFLEKVTEEEKTVYLFENLFINKFFPKDIKKIENYEDKFDYDNKNVDDDVIQIFKIAKLLGKNGEFSRINNLIKIAYNNLNVKRIGGNNYSIKIVDSEIIYEVGEGAEVLKYVSNFNSDYRLSSDKHYFYNIYLETYYLNSSGNKYFLFPGIKIKILGKIDLIDFEKDIAEFFGQLRLIKQKYNELENKEDIKEIHYSIKSKKINFK